MAYGVKLLLDSVNPKGIRLCTWELTYPRFVHSELLTHRQFSKCSASSRAIPTPKMLERIEVDPVMPVWWGKNQSGMQAKEELSGNILSAAKAIWLCARDSAVAYSRKLHELGAHKQITNRVTEPWMWITVIMSTTFHANWFMLRDHKDAQPEIACLAKQMHDMYWEHKPIFIPEGEWHMPLLFDKEDLIKEGFDNESLRRISVSRCARTSYLSHDGIRDPKEDAVGLFQKLRTSDPMHLSPFEHVAESTNTMDMFGNFKGWCQYRKKIFGESGPTEPLFNPRTGECINYDSATRKPIRL